jgi:chromate transport protein ChrA
MEEHMHEETMEEPRTRPAGVSILAVLVAIQAAFLMVMGIVFLVRFLTSQPQTALLTGVLPALLGLLAFGLVWALWNMKRWSYWASIVVAILSLLVATLTFDQHSPSSLLTLGSALFSVLALSYQVASREVRTAFRVHQTTESADQEA